MTETPVRLLTLYSPKQLFFDRVTYSPASFGSHEDVDTFGRNMKHRQRASRKEKAPSLTLNILRTRAARRNGPAEI